MNDAHPISPRSRAARARHRATTTRSAGDVPPGQNPVETTGTDAAGPTVLPLYTPKAAAELLGVRESWLRRRVAARAVPCRFIGKHLRFSHDDVLAIIQAAAHPATTAPRPARRHRAPSCGHGNHSAARGAAQPYTGARLT